MKPTVELVRQVWEAHPDPSVRTVAEQLRQEGFTISFRTVARWKKNDWLSNPKGGGAKAIDTNQHTPAAVKNLIRNALQSMPQEDVAQANEIAAAGGLEQAVNGGKLTDEDYERIAKRTAELAQMTAAQLLETQEKARTIMNIVLMEEAVRKAHVMVLIPKDTGSFMSDAAEASKVMTATVPIMPADAHEGNGSDAKLIEGKSVEMSPLSAAIKRVRAEVTA